MLSRGDIVSCGRDPSSSTQNVRINIWLSKKLRDFGYQLSITRNPSLASRYGLSHN
ncbi:hypothetical protein T08_9906 [Trichinella sp. T8]|nr:hypothetical protein T08_9906 [Trichinella sp. T8]